MIFWNSLIKLQVEKYFRLSPPFLCFILFLDYGTLVFLGKGLNMDYFLWGILGGFGISFVEWGDNHVRIFKKISILVNFNKILLNLEKQVKKVGKAT
jgi:hypothetical protein